MAAYNRAVQDYKNSADVQLGLASYYSTLGNVKSIYPKIIAGLNQLYGEDITQKVVDGQRVVANEVIENQIRAKESANARLDSELKDLGEKQSAIYDRSIVNNKIENRRMALLKRRSEEHEDINQEIDTKTKLTFINNNSFRNKVSTVSKLHTTLLFLTLITFISYIGYMRIFSGRAIGWLIGLSILGYLVTMIRRFYWKDIIRAEYRVLDYLVPDYMARMCPEGC